MSSSEKDIKLTSRRNFLQTGLVLLGGSAVLLEFGCAPTQRKVFDFVDSNEAPNMGLNKFDANFWIRILDDNKIELASPKVEMGQGVFTGAALCAAEELNTHPRYISVIHPTTQNGPVDPFGTGGSSSTAGLFEPVRKAAAITRVALEEAAAKIWKTSASNVEAKDGKVVYADKSLSFAEIIKQSKSIKFRKKGPALKTRKDFQYIGTDQPRTDLLQKVMGASIFGIDYELPNMVYGTTVESPYLGGKLKSFDADEALAMKGVLEVQEEDDYLLVVAEKRYVAEMAARKVKAEWTVNKKWTQEDIDAAVQVGKGKFESIQKDGNAAAVFRNKDQGKTLEFEYRTAAAAHAFMEPKGTIARYADGKMYIITGTQQPNRDRVEIAKKLSMKKDDVDVQCAFLGGGFGGRFYINKVIQAARASKKLGRPIHVLSTREQDFINNYYRPSSHHVMKAKIENNQIVAVQHDMATDDMIFDFMPAIMQKLMGADPSSCHGAAFNYSIDSRVTNSWRVDTPYVTGIWRGVGIVATSFAKEVFFDEIAEELGQDPIEMRLAHLKDEKDARHGRLRTVVEKVRDASNWKGKSVAGFGKGFACAMDRETVVAGVAEVTVDNGKIKVTKFTLGIDAGLIVNPEGVRQQCEGCIMMGLSSAIYEELLVKDGKVNHSNYHQYPVAMLSDSPEIEILLLGTGEHVYGVGEPPIAPVAPAIANALYSATGKRFRNTPFRNDLS